MTAPYNDRADQGEIVYGCDVPGHPNNFTHRHGPTSDNTSPGVSS